MDDLLSEDTRLLICCTLWTLPPGLGPPAAAVFVSFNTVVAFTRFYYRPQIPLFSTPLQRHKLAFWMEIILQPVVFVRSNLIAGFRAVKLILKESAFYLGGWLCGWSSEGPASCSVRVETANYMDGLLFFLVLPSSLFTAFFISFWITSFFAFPSRRWKAKLLPF